MSIFLLHILQAGSPIRPVKHQTLITKYQERVTDRVINSKYWLIFHYFLLERMQILSYFYRRFSYGKIEII